jgi:hypothetical protein
MSVATLKTVMGARHFASRVGVGLAKFGQLRDLPGFPKPILPFGPPRWPAAVVERFVNNPADFVSTEALADLVVHGNQTRDEDVPAGYLSVRQVQQRLYEAGVNYSEAVIRLWIRNGQLPAERIKGRGPVSFFYAVKESALTDMMGPSS